MYQLRIRRQGPTSSKLRIQSAALRERSRIHTGLKTRRRVQSIVHNVATPPSLQDLCQFCVAATNTSCATTRTFNRVIAICPGHCHDGGSARDPGIESSHYSVSQSSTYPAGCTLSNQVAEHVEQL